MPPWVVLKVPSTTDRVPPSTSVSLASRSRVELNGTSSVTLTASSTATGASFTGVTVRLTVIVSMPPWPSLTTTMKLSLPW
ncbi:hypothetical protein D3C75_858350 [compost metagenome]